MPRTQDRALALRRIGKVSPGKLRGSDGVQGRGDAGDRAGRGRASDLRPAMGADLRRGWPVAGVGKLHMFPRGNMCSTKTIAACVIEICKCFAQAPQQVFLGGPRAGMKPDRHPLPIK